VDLPGGSWVCVCHVQDVVHCLECQPNWGQEDTNTSSAMHCLQVGGQASIDLILRITSHCQLFLLIHAISCISAKYFCYIQNVRFGAIDWDNVGQ
jgi:hypothetical protein